MKTMPSLKKSLLSGAILTASFTLTSPATAMGLEGDVQAGKKLSTSCAACHGADGNSASPAFPNIAGQPFKYTAYQLEAYRDGGRDNAIMAPQAAGLSDQDIADLAAYYAAQTRKATPENDTGSALGQRIYEMGRDNVASCASCHGKQGKGNIAAGFPQLRGLTENYSRESLVAYREDSRKARESDVMHLLAVHLTDEEIDALSAHIAAMP